MTKQTNYEILLNLIDGAMVTQDWLALYIDHVNRLIDELQELPHGNRTSELIKLLILVTGEMNVEINALNGELEEAEEARKVVNNE
ncbi:unnamed protein product [Fructobacillus cardui]|uniref:hypothetical protein n=1 Tax=Fructobacillus cardui TaxID=2893170 RepID=UPI002D941E8B|nr:unnamed protein product [Fructobacillus cardui]